MGSAAGLTSETEEFPGKLCQRRAGSELADGLWSLDAIQIRGFATDRHRSVDDTPAGGGAGMGMRADILAAAVDAAAARHTGNTVLAMTPRERPLTQSDRKSARLNSRH